MPKTKTRPAAGEEARANHASTDSEQLTDQDLREIVEVFVILNGWYEERERRKAEQRPIAREGG